MLGNVKLEAGDSAFVWADGPGLFVDKVVVDGYDHKRECFKGWAVPVGIDDPALPYPVEFCAGQVMDVLKFPTKLRGSINSEGGKV